MWVSYQSKEATVSVDSNSDATVIVDADTKPPVPTKNKTRGHNKKPNKKRKQKTFVTKTYVLRKGGLPGKAKKKRRKPYLFKCLMCSIRWPTCKERNDHFKQKHHKASIQKV